MPHTPTKFILTPHVKKRMLERRFTEEQAIDAIKAPNGRWKQYKGTHGGWVHLFHKKHGSATLAVAAEIDKGVCYLVTGYWK